MVPVVATHTVDHKDPDLLMVTNPTVVSLTADNRTEGTLDLPADLDLDVISLEVPALKLDQVLRWAQDQTHTAIAMAADLPCHKDHHMDQDLSNPAEVIQEGNLAQKASLEDKNLAMVVTDQADQEVVISPALPDSSTVAEVQETWVDSP